MNNKEIYKLHADFCKFMGNPRRIEILFLLGNNELCVEEIAQSIGITITNVSQNLSVMRSRDVVEFRREGKNIYYKLADRRILDACIIMRDVMLEQAKNKVKTISRNKP
jgi:ArsR family transcriptional regulator